jgi:hypothetical protein
MSTLNSEKFSSVALRGTIHNTVPTLPVLRASNFSSIKARQIIRATLERFLLPQYASTTRSSSDVFYAGLLSSLEELSSELSKRSSSSSPSSNNDDNDDQAQLVYGAAIATFGDLSYFKKTQTLQDLSPSHRNEESINVTTSSVVDSAITTFSAFLARAHKNTGLDEYQLLQSSILATLSKFLATSSSNGISIYSLPILPNSSVIALRQAKFVLKT